MRRKVEELELANESSKKQIKELQEKVRALSASTKDKPSVARTLTSSESSEKLRNKDKEISELKIKLNEKERAIDKLTSELKNSKSVIPTGSESQQVATYKRQLDIVEREASVLRTKVQTLEKEFENITNENRKLAVRIAKSDKDGKNGKGGDLEKQLATANTELSEFSYFKSKPAFANLSVLLFRQAKRNANSADTKDCRV